MSIPAPIASGSRQERLESDAAGHKPGFSAIPGAAGRRATVVTDAFTVDLAAGRVSAGGQDVRLTPTEWRLLEVLARNPGRVVDHRRLLLDVWGPAYQDQTNYLRVFTATLRRKLEADPAHPRHLLTEAGRGYRFEI